MLTIAILGFQPLTLMFYFKFVSKGTQRGREEEYAGEGSANI